MSLVTRCPKCESRFLIEPDQLSEHDGLVRCGECSHIFDGFGALESKLPTLTRRLPGHAAHSAPVASNPFANIPDLDLDPYPEDGTRSTLEWDSEPAPAPIPTPAVALATSPPVVDAQPSVIRQRSASPGATTSITSQVDQSAFSLSPDVDLPLRGESRKLRQHLSTPEPDFGDSHEGMGFTSILMWGLGCLLAIILLCGQLIYIYRNDIATNAPALRSTLDSICARLGCEVSLSRHLDRIAIDGASLDQTGVAQQEGQPSEQVLRFTMRNRYEKNQPWPHLMIELTDPSSTVVVRKVVAPYQYLPANLVDQSFAAQQEVKLALPITVMGLHINGFNIQKFFP